MIRPELAHVRNHLVTLGMLVCAFLVISAAGCLQRTVAVASGGSGGHGVTTTTGGKTTVNGPAVGSTTTSITAPGGPSTAVAMMTSELPQNAMECGMVSPCNPPADMLFLEIASPSNSCQAPLGDMAPAFYWNLQIGLPAQYQAVGTYALTDPAIYWEGELMNKGPQLGAEGTSGAPGSGSGSIQITSIDKLQISFRLMSGQTIEDGDYVAKRCTPLP